MEITTQTVLKYFLKKLEQELISGNSTGISPFFQNFFTHEELITIIKWKYKNAQIKYPKLGSMDKKDLEQIIRSDTYILAYYNDRWKESMYSKESLTKEEVKITLKQLCLHAHYLLDKPIEKWDRYDIGNFQSLQLKAGRLQRVYGLYDIRVSQENAHLVESLPRRFYQRLEHAQSERLHLTGSDIDRAEEVHILTAFKAR